jgi:hypothetical protein
VVVVHSGGPVVVVGLGRAAVVVVGPGPVRVVAGLSSTGARSSEAGAGVNVAGGKEVDEALVPDVAGRVPGEPALTLTPAPCPAHAPLVKRKSARTIHLPRRPDRIIDRSPIPNELGIRGSDADRHAPDPT